MVNSHWGDVVEDNSFGTHEFMALCELLGADPYVSANVGSGTVREAAEWIEYLTRADDSPMARLRRANGRDEPWKVPFWGLGNEPWGCGGGMGSGAYAELARQYGTYSLDHGDNHLYRIAAGAADADYRWTEVLMQNLGRHLGVGEVTGHGTNTYQAVSFHHYTIVGDTWDANGVGDPLRHRRVLPHDGEGRGDRADPRRPRERHGRLRPRQARGPRARRVGHVVRRRTRHEPRVPVPAEHPARRPRRLGALRRLPPARRPARHGEHRPDGQRAAGHAAPPTATRSS